MKKTADNHAIDLAIGNFNLSLEQAKEPTKKLPITIWLPEDYKLKYGTIQGKSRNEFGKHIQKAIMKLIDSVNID